MIGDDLKNMRKKDHKIQNTISTIIAYAVLSGPVIILIVVMACSYFGKIKSVIDNSPFNLPFEKKVYYSIDDEYYHDSQDCPALKNSDHILSAYRKELTGKTPCEQCIGNARN